MSRYITILVVGVGLCSAQPDPTIEQNLAAQLQRDPNNVPFLLKLGSLKLEHRAFDEAQTCFERVLATDSNNTTALFDLAVLGWTRVFAELRTARTTLAMEPETPGPLRDRATRAILTAKYAQTLADSIADLQRVLVIDPQNNDAMAYMNLLYRAKADLEETPEAYRADVATGDEWVQKTLATVRAKHDAGLPIAPALVPPPPPIPANGSMRIRVGGNVQAANLISKVDPVYPEMAQRARIQGVIKFNAVIARDGTILNLTVVSGHPMLVQAALEAVKNWIYKPTLLNGEPVEVITNIEVPFTLP